MGGAAVPLLAAGLALRTIVVSSLEEEFDGALWPRRNLTLTEQENGRIQVELDVDICPSSRRPRRLRAPMGRERPLRRSHMFDASERDIRVSLFGIPQQKGAPRSFGGLPDGRRGRQIRVDFVPAPDAPDPRLGAGGRAAPPSGASRLQRATLIVARERVHLDAAVRRLELIGVGLGVGLLLMLAGSMQLALRVGLRSLDRDGTGAGSRRQLSEHATRGAGAAGGDRGGGRAGQRAPGPAGGRIQEGASDVQ